MTDVLKIMQPFPHVASLTEREDTPDGTLAFLIGFYLSFRIILGIFFVRVLGADPQAGAEARLALSFFLVGTVWLLSLGSSRDIRSTWLKLPAVRWACAFLALALCSLLWGEAASTSSSFAYWCGTASDVLLIVLIMSTGPAFEIARSLMTGFIWSTAIISLIAWIMPAQYDLRLGDEDFFNSNSIGNLCAFAIFFIQYLTRRYEEERWPLMTLFLGITLLRSLSKTTLAAFLVGECYLIMQDRSMSRRAKVLTILTSLLVLVVFWGLLQAYFDFYTSYGNESVTLTGRTAIWAYVGAEALLRPWWGHGFDSMWKVIPPFGSFEARHAENELLEQFYSYGAIGLVVLIGVYGSLYRSVRRFCHRPERVVFITMLLYVVVRGFAESEPFDLLLPLWMVVLLSVLIGKGPAVVGELQLPCSGSATAG